MMPLEWLSQIKIHLGQLRDQIHQDSMYQQAVSDLVVNHDAKDLECLRHELGAEEIPVLCDIFAVRVDRFGSEQFVDSDGVILISRLIHEHIQLGHSLSGAGESDFFVDNFLVEFSLADMLAEGAPPVDSTAIASRIIQENLVGVLAGPDKQADMVEV